LNNSSKVDIILFYVLLIGVIGGFESTVLYPIPQTYATSGGFLTSASQCFPITSTSGQIKILSAFDGLGRLVCNNAPTSSNSILINFVGPTPTTGRPLVVNQCSFDGSAFSTCSSPFIRNDLSRGTAHTFQVKSGSDSTPANFTWTVTVTTTLSDLPSSSLIGPDRPCIGGLPCGHWNILSNGLIGDLFIRSVDSHGKMNGSLFEQDIHGSWNQALKKISFMQTIMSGSNQSVSYEYTGFFHNICGIPNVVKDPLKCNIISGFAIPKTVSMAEEANRQFGWIAIYNSPVITPGPGGGAGSGEKTATVTTPDGQALVLQNDLNPSTPPGSTSEKVTKSTIPQGQGILVLSPPILLTPSEKAVPNQDQ
jgi:hypothetical protein